MSRIDSLISRSDGRAALAVAQTLIPGTARIPAADESLVTGVEELVREISPALVRPWILAQRLLAAAARASARQPLGALSAEQREDVLRQWEKNAALRVPLSLLSILYKAVHFDSARVYGALRERPETPAVLEQPRWLEQVHSAESWPPNEGDIECDAVVVGTGAGGAVVGRELADRGYAVVFMERGEHYRRDAFDGSAIGAHRRFYTIAASVGNAVIPIMAGRLVGGSSAVNGGTCFRTPRWILDKWCEDLGTDAFAPERMEPLFRRVEAFTSVGPARQPEIGPIQGVFERGCQALGWSHAPVRRNVDGCDGKGFCDFGCRTDARRSTNLSYIPAALEKGAVLFTGMRADRVLVEGRRAVGLEAVSKNGRRLRVRARAVVLAGGALPTPLLLLKQGLCNRSGEVGRNLSLHPSTGVGALMDDEICGWQHIPQGYTCDQFLRQGELIIASQPDVNVAPELFPLAGQRLMETLDSLSHIAYAGLLVRDSSSAGRIWFEARGKPAISYTVSPEDRDALHSVMMHTIDLFVAAGAKRLYPARHSSPILELGDVDRFRRSVPAASDIALISYHPLGSCRMGRDPRKSVVGVDHQAHDLRGLFIVDGSTVPSAPGVNPQLTIMALATRAAECIGDALG